MGATWDGHGTNFALYSSVAFPGGVTLCLVADDGTETRLALSERTGDVWHGYIPGIGPGQRYGYRVAGPYAASLGLLLAGGQRPRMQGPPSRRLGELVSLRLQSSPDIRGRALPSFEAQTRSGT